MSETERIILFFLLSIIIIGVLNHIIEGGEE